MAQQPKHGDGNLNLLYKIADNTYDISQNGGGGGGPFAPLIHANTHASNGYDPITPESIGAAPINNPEFTGTATFGVVGEETADLFVGGNGSVGIGTESPSESLDVVGNIVLTGTIVGSESAPTQNGQLANKYYVDNEISNVASATAGGDLSGNYPNPTVGAIQGQPISNATPYNGQVLQYDGTTWVPGTIPTGGSGGGGVIYYLNFNTSADAPLTNIPQTPNSSKELGIVGDVTGTSYLSATLPTASYALLASFVTDLNIPSATAVPAGIWDFNIFAESTTTNNANQIYFKIEVLKYNGVNAPTLLATSNDTYIYDPAEINQYVASVVMPQTTVLATDRIVVYLYGRAHQNNNRLTFYFGGAYPSHTHSTMPSVTGSGVAKVVNGVFQSPASTIVDADVSASAAIAQSKIANLTTDLGAKALSADVQIFTSSGTWTKPAGAKAVNIQLIGGGGGGGAGQKNSASAVNRGGGGGGGGGGFFQVFAPASALSATESVVIGAGGVGGTGTAIDNTTVPGVAGGTTSFASFLVQGGNGGSGGITTGGNGGLGFLAGHNGGNGAANSTGVAGVPTAAVNFTSGGAGGAGGGGVSSGETGFAGGVGGFSRIINLSGGSGGAAGGNPGTNGLSNTNASNGIFAVGSGGGGGGGLLAGNGGNGGNGGFPSSGGGGGGATRDGTSGSGGAGGNGIAIITTYF